MAWARGEGAEVELGAAASEGGTESTALALCASAGVNASLDQVKGELWLSVLERAAGDRRLWGKLVESVVRASFSSALKGRRGGRV